MKITAKISVSFSLTGDCFNVDFVTNQMNLSPTMSWSGNVSSPMGCAKNGWTYEIYNLYSDSVAAVFLELIDILSEKKAAIKDLCSNYSLTASFQVAIHMVNSLRPEIILTKEILDFAASLSSEIAFDIYGYENEEDVLDVIKCYEE